MNLFSVDCVICCTGHAPLTVEHLLLMLKKEMPEATSKKRKTESVTIPSDLKWMPKVVGEVERVVEEAGFDEQSSDFLAIAVTEGVNNAILHGNKQDSTKKVTIQFDQTPKQLAISITDEGTGFNPKECRNPTDPENISKRSGRGTRWAAACCSAGASVRSSS